MSQQYQKVAEDLREMYVFAERTEKLEALLKIQRFSMLKQAEIEANTIENVDEANKLFIAK